MSNRLVVLTGLDRVGKETQSKLLARALGATRFSSPDYDHWSGQIIKAVLYEERFELVRHGPSACPERVTLHSQTKHPEIFQSLQSINMLARLEAIQSSLATGHVVMDRWGVDTLAYGLIDGCDMRYLLELDRLLIPADYVFILVGKPFPRPGEEPDINERDPVFQQKVRDAYTAYALQHPETSTVIHVDRFANLRPQYPMHSIRMIHQALCDTLTDRLGLPVQALGGQQIHEVLPHIHWQ